MVILYAFNDVYQDNVNKSTLKLFGLEPSDISIPSHIAGMNQEGVE